MQDLILFLCFYFLDSLIFVYDIYPTDGHISYTVRDHSRSAKKQETKRVLEAVTDKDWTVQSLLSHHLFTLYFSTFTIKSVLNKRRSKLACEIFPSCFFNYRLSVPSNDCAIRFTGMSMQEGDVGAGWESVTSPHPVLPSGAAECSSSQLMLIHLVKKRGHGKSKSCGTERIDRNEVVKF